MKKITIAIIAILIINKGFCQADIAKQNTLDSISKIVIHYLQDKQADSLYSLSGEHFKSQLTEENFKSIANGQVFPLNDFQKVTFISTENGVNSYKVEGKPELKLLISLDEKNRLETFLIKPFTD